LANTYGAIACWDLNTSKTTPVRKCQVGTSSYTQDREEKEKEIKFWLGKKFKDRFFIG